ncbi:MAG: LPS export ABC transporter permease LptG [Acidimicrobiia bacterium]|nr:LPS export ABC transporter permease LptG [Acidimicrobiia bacterium]
MKLIDRYVIREVLWPFAIGLVVFTFLLIIPYLVRDAEEFIAKGVSAPVILQIVWLLVPAQLGVTIPMALLLGLLVAFGRLSADREYVALQACGVSLLRLLRPVALLAIPAWAASSYVLIVSIPAANQQFREITYDIVAARAEGEVRPRVFFEDFPTFVLYVREVPATGGWQDVFMADTRDPQAPAIYMAKSGRVILDRAARTVEMELQQGERHTASPEGTYEVVRFDRTLLTLDPESVFPEAGPPKGDAEMTVAELRARAAEIEASGGSSHNQHWYIHQKFSIPFACVVFGVIGLALGATSRRDGKLASFVIGVSVIFAYYVLLWLHQALNRGHFLPPWLAVWMPNVILGGFGLWLFVRRARAVDRPLHIPVPAFVRRRADADARPGRIVTAAFRLPGPGLLDRYVASTYVRIAGLSALSMAGIFYIATFLDMADEVFKGIASWTTLGTYFWYATPQYVYYVLPLSVLLATLVTIGLLTKNSELVVMKACGISLYRVALPMVAGALVAGGVLFALEETILGPSNRQAEAIRHVIRGGNPQTFDVLNRRWVSGTDGEIYHYNFFDARTRQLNGLSIYQFARPDALARRTYVERASYVSGDRWRVEEGWIREFAENGETRAYTPITQNESDIEPVAYFATQQPDERFMSYSQLRDYVVRLRASGFDVSQQQVALERKISFPFVTIVMTLIAIPFAVTTGRRGAMYGIGVGIVLALAYWTAISVFAALGSGGLVHPTLAAWAPNLLFGAGAGYLLLTVRT